MTSPEPLTRNELIELAALDALGLLDEFEAAHYTRSFLHAPATVQDDIRRIQAEVAKDESLLPDDQPPAELREKVLLRVAEAIEADAVRHAPLATIGRRHVVDGRIEWRPGNSSIFWRAAVFALAGAVVVIAYFWSEANSHSKRIADLALSRLTDLQLIEEVGPPITDFVFDENAQRIVLLAMSPDKIGPAASLFLRPATDGSDNHEAFLVFDGLDYASDDAYRLQVTQADETRSVVRTFDSTGALGGIQIQAIRLTTAMLATATWQITTAAGEVLLSS